MEVTIKLRENVELEVHIDQDGVVNMEGAMTSAVMLGIHDITETEIKNAVVNNFEVASDDYGGQYWVIYRVRDVVIRVTFSLAEEMSKKYGSISAPTLCAIVHVIIRWSEIAANCPFDDFDRVFDIFNDFSNNPEFVKHFPNLESYEDGIYEILCQFTVVDDENMEQ